MRLPDYLARVGIDSIAGWGSETLRRVHLAHKETFLFENLTIQAGGGISVALDDIERKFLDEGRGGYCFEHNTLFGAALGALGFAPVTLLGRVRRGPPDRWARTHMVLRVEADGESWLADVGFGGAGLLEPMLLRDGAVTRQGGFDYALRREPHAWVLSMHDAAAGTDLYEFAEEPQTPGDVEVANHYTSTHPSSIFRQTLTVQQSLRDERIILRNTILARFREGHALETAFERRELHDVVRTTFGIELPPGPFVCDTYSRPIAAS